MIEVHNEEYLALLNGEDRNLELRKALVSQAVDFAKYQFGLQLKDTLHIYLYDDVIDSSEGEDYSALLNITVDETPTIHISCDQPGDQFFESLFHELVHYWQWERGDLSVRQVGIEDTDTKAFWKGEPTEHRYKRMAESVPPFEDEAYDLQCELTDEFVETYL